MTPDEHRGSVDWNVLRLVYAVLFFSAAVAYGGPVALPRALELPLSALSGMAGELVPPAGTASKLVFESGAVAIGDVPAPLPERAAPRRRGHAGQRAAATTPGGPRARLLLTGVVDADGNPVTNSGNQLVIDALVSPSAAAPPGEPLTVPFDLNAGYGFVDVALPIEAPASGPVRLQIIGISVVDPDGQAFATLGFEVPAQRPTPAASGTPPALPTAGPEGWCFRGSSCTGASVPSSLDDCCRSSSRPGQSPFMLAASWCAADQFDASTGQCSAQACQMCAPPATPTPGPCASLASCGGGCTLPCPDGTTVAGQCAPDAGGTCQCAAWCAAPTPCGAGECFDTMTGNCTGQPCDAALHCPLPNEVCDIGGQRCPCQPPAPLPQGHICCQCKDRTPACIDFSYAEVQPICPPGCDTLMGQECDAAGTSCVALAPCASDQDCDDGNSCTVDRCSPSGCTHDCVCVGPGECGPGPTRGAP